MPKARKAKRAKAKSRPRKKSKSKPSRETKSDDSRQRELLLKVINRLGASVTVSDDPDVLIVKQFNAKPFAIYYKHFAVEDVGVEPQPVEVSIPTDAGGEPRAAE
jgi:hypothetical protein